MEHQIAEWLFVVGAKWSAHGREGNVRPPRGLLNQSVFVAICVTGFVGSRLESGDGGEKYSVFLRDVCRLEEVLCLHRDEIRVTSGANAKKTKLSFFFLYILHPFITHALEITDVL